MAVIAFKIERSGYAWGRVVPAALMGLVLIARRLGVGLRANGLVAELQQQYAESPAATAQQELPRMDRVNRNSRTTCYVFGGPVVLGLFLHYFASTNLGRGLGSVLMLLGETGLSIHDFAERRAELYTAVLQSLAGKPRAE